MRTRLPASDLMGVAPARGFAALAPESFRLPRGSLAARPCGPAHIRRTPSRPRRVRRSECRLGGAWRDSVASPDAATCAHSWRAPQAPSCRWQGARSRRDRSASPCAILARRSAVAGATTTRSASRERRIWPISASSLRSKSSVKVFSSVSTESESGVMNSAPPFVRIARTRSAPLLQAAHEIEALIGGDAAADDQEDALAVHVCSHSRSSCPAQAGHPGARHGAWHWIPSFGGYRRRAGQDPGQ